MNERIQELYLHAFPPSLNDSTTVQMSAEKFAELIVRECMNMCDVEKADYTKYRKNAWDREEKEIYAEGEAACDTIKHRMKYGFEVK